MTTSEPDWRGSNRLTSAEFEAWRRLLSVANRGLEQIDQELQRRSNLTLTDYEILLALSEADDRRLRMSELAKRVAVSRSRLTYRVDRLTEVDFVTREECEDDRRGLWAILTDRGEESLSKATDGHHGDIRRIIFDHLDDGLELFSRMLRRITDKLDEE